ncbi:hypothetical protein WJX73_010741 [Symbiochloris irregularis]|uniref:tRNA pseudouridine(55) synthase n=1 Tax=Symbiochloris irregularis TaxID=706552 RepID=A0AAW1NEP1_9CHLO
MTISQTEEIAEHSVAAEPSSQANDSICYGAVLIAAGREPLKAIISDLLDFGCCPRCCLRLCGLRAGSLTPAGLESVPTTRDLLSAVRSSTAAAIASVLRAEGHTGESVALEVAQDGVIKVKLSYLHPASASETDILFGGTPSKRLKAHKRKHGSQPVTVGRAATEHIRTLADAAARQVLQQHQSRAPACPSARAHLLVQVRSETLLVGGYYTKAARNVSNSPFFVEGKRKGVTSVEEELARFLHPLLGCSSSKFVSAGREDMDVRMLGSGRPFVLQCINPRMSDVTPEALAEVQRQIAAAQTGVQATCLQVVDKEQLTDLKAGAPDKQKSYCALCQLPCKVTAEVVAKLTSSQELPIKQFTPQRVAHRRALLERQRSIYSMRCELVEGQDQLCTLFLRTQAGTCNPHVFEFGLRVS